MVQGDGFEPSKLSRQIYSLIPLATREPLLRESAFSNSDPLVSTCFFNENTKLQQKASIKSGAGDRSRTYDLLITSQLLYQLSYASSTSHTSTKTPFEVTLLKRGRDSR